MIFQWKIILVLIIPSCLCIAAAEKYDSRKIKKSVSIKNLKKSAVGRCNSDSGPKGRFAITKTPETVTRPNSARSSSSNELPLKSDSPLKKWSENVTTKSHNSPDQNELPYASQPTLIAEIDPPISTDDNTEQEQCLHDFHNLIIEKARYVLDDTTSDENRIADYALLISTICQRVLTKHEQCLRHNELEFTQLHKIISHKIERLKYFNGLVKLQPAELDIMQKEKKGTTLEHYNELILGEAKRSVTDDIEALHYYSMVELEAAKTILSIAIKNYRRNVQNCSQDQQKSYKALQELFKSDSNKPEIKQLKEVTPEQLVYLLETAIRRTKPSSEEA